MVYESYTLNHTATNDINQLISGEKCVSILWFLVALHLARPYISTRIYPIYLVLPDKLFIDFNEV